MMTVEMKENIEKLISAEKALSRIMSARVEDIDESDVADAKMLKRIINKKRVELGLNEKNF